MCRLQKPFCHWMTSLLFLNLLFCISEQPAYAKITAKMEIKKNVVRLGESTNLVITLQADAGESLSAPTFPEYEWAVVEHEGQSEQHKFTYVNGQMSSVKTLELIYEVTPLRTGQFAFTDVRLRNNSATIQPVRITVLESGTPSSSQNQSSNQPTHTLPDESEQNEYGLSLIAEIPKKDYYVGEEIILTYYLYYPLTTRDIQVQKIEDSRNQFQGFWKEQVDIKRQYERLPGHSQVRAPIMRYVLYPLTPGQHTIESIRLECNIANRRTIFLQRYRPTGVASRPLTLNVKPLPEENKPDIFEGAVGKFQLDSSVELTDVEEGDHVSLQVTLSGQGNIKNAPSPILPDLSKFDQYDPTREESIQVTQTGMSGQITYNHPLLPHDVTANQIGPVRYAYFDPEQETYRVLETNPIRLNIIPNANQTRGGSFGNNRRIITRIGDDFRFIDTLTLAISNVFMPVYLTPQFWLLTTLAIMVLLSSSGLKWRMDYLERNPKVAKSLSAPKQAKRLLSEARQSMQSGKTESIYSQLGKAVTDYISNRWNMACAGMTSNDLRQALPQHGVSEECTEQVIQLLEELDAARFSGSAKNPEHIKEDYEKTERILGALMNQKSHV